jgi:hypothetical protein
MFAGLPGTGIGGIFYLLLTLWMPIHELYLTFTGRSSLARWRFIGVRWCLFAAVLGVMWLQVTLLRGIMPQGAPAASVAAAKDLGSAVGVTVKADTSSGLMLATGIYTTLVLMSVVGFVHLVRIGLWYRKRFDELAYQEDLPGQWQRLRRHFGEHATDILAVYQRGWELGSERVRSGLDRLRSPG